MVFTLWGLGLRVLGVEVLLLGGERRVEGSGLGIQGMSCKS